jgi:hypothetical protein
MGVEYVAKVLRTAPRRGGRSEETHGETEKGPAEERSGLVRAQGERKMGARLAKLPVARQEQLEQEQAPNRAGGRRVS